MNVYDTRIGGGTYRTPEQKRKDRVKVFEFKDKFGNTISPGSFVVYGVENYGTSLTRVGRVQSIYQRIEQQYNWKTKTYEPTEVYSMHILTYSVGDYRPGETNNSFDDSTIVKTEKIIAYPNLAVPKEMQDALKLEELRRSVAKRKRKLERAEFLAKTGHVAI